MSFFWEVIHIEYMNTVTIKGVWNLFCHEMNFRLQGSLKTSITYIMTLISKCFKSCLTMLSELVLREFIFFWGGGLRVDVMVKVFLDSDILIFRVLFLEFCVVRIILWEDFAILFDGEKVFVFVLVKRGWKVLCNAILWKLAK